MPKYEKGQSGNPKGREKGKETQSTKVRKLLLSNAEPLIAKVVELALAGDCTALKLCLDRICPTLKPSDEPISKCLISHQDSLSKQGLEIIKNLDEGILSPQQANVLMSSLLMQAKLTEYSDWASRLDEIEKKIESSSNISCVSAFAEEAECYPAENR